MIGLVGKPGNINLLKMKTCGSFYVPSLLAPVDCTKLTANVQTTLPPFLEKFTVGLGCHSCQCHWTQSLESRLFGQHWIHRHQCRIHSNFLTNLSKFVCPGKAIVLYFRKNNTLFSMQKYLFICINSASKTPK